MQQDKIKLYSVKVRKKAQLAVSEVLASGKLAAGEKVHQLEEEFSHFVGARHGVAVTSGTAALHTAMVAAGVGPGDEVIVPAFTFVATANAPLMVGAQPVFADIDPQTYCLSVEDVARKISKRTKAIIAVNLYGLPADYQRLHEIIGNLPIKLIEDAAQSTGASIMGVKSGTLADMACFSFYATKNMMSGEGGMVTMNDETLFQKALLFRQHGQPTGARYVYEMLGINYLTTEMQATLALDELETLPERNRRRRVIAAHYNQAFFNTGLLTPVIAEGFEHVFHQYTLKVNKPYPLTRNQLKEKLREKGIDSGIYYPQPLYRYDHLKPYAPKNGLPETEMACDMVLSIPVHPYLTDTEVDKVIEAVVNR